MSEHGNIIRRMLADIRDGEDYDHAYAAAEGYANHIENLNAALAAAQEALAAQRAILKVIEWHHETRITLSGERIEVNMCPICDQTPDRGHAPDCTLAAALYRSLVALAKLTAAQPQRGKT